MFSQFEGGTMGNPDKPSTPSTEDVADGNFGFVFVLVLKVTENDGTQSSLSLIL